MGNTFSYKRKKQPTVQLYSEHCRTSTGQNLEEKYLKYYFKKF